MTGAPDRDRPASSSCGAPRERGGPVEPAERFGPLAISRHVKDDGRALILFTRRREDDEEDRGDGEADRNQGAAAERRS
jgi:hypothetical protein